MVKLVLKSRQFWLAFVDLVVKLVVLMMATFAPAEATKFWNEFWAICQPFVLFLISIFTVDDAATMIAISRGGAGVGIATRGIGEMTGNVKEQARMLIAGVWK